jgi:D-lyxose ketol-isomerase
MMDAHQLNAVTQQVKDLIQTSGFILSADEWSRLALNDMGLGDILTEGFAFVDILRSPKLRITILVLLPNQSLPQHVHPPYDDEPGKEETLRVLYGHTKVFVEGEACSNLHIPKGKEPYYTARQEIAMDAGGQYTIAPGIKHWFQAGPQGSVSMTFQNRVDETRNLFDDPDSLGCPITMTD